MTFLELYQQAVDAPTPRQVFMDRVMKVTGCSYNTVKAWLYGMREPGRETKTAIAAEYGCDVEELFPEDGAEKTK